jgi:hypothetical protein
MITGPLGRLVSCQLAASSASTTLGQYSDTQRLQKEWCNFTLVFPLSVGSADRTAKTKTTTRGQI